MIRIFIKSNVEIYHTAATEENPFVVLVKNKEPELLNEMLQSSMKGIEDACNNAWEYFIRNIEDVDLFQYFLDMELPIFRGCPITKAIDLQSREAFKMILNHGMDPDMLYPRDKHLHFTKPRSICQDIFPLISVIIDLHDTGFDIVKDLIVGGADVNHKNSCGETPLLFLVKHYETTYGVHENKLIFAPQVKVDFLLENGADILSRNNDGYSSLMIASENGYSEFVRRMLNSLPTSYDRIMDVC